MGALAYRASSSWRLVNELSEKPPLSAAVIREEENLQWPARRFSLAPMMEVSDRHFRVLMRMMTKKMLLYTEMIVDQTLLYNLEPRENQEYYLGHNGEISLCIRLFAYTYSSHPTLDPPPSRLQEVEMPLAVQLGGNNPTTLGQAAKVCEEWGGYQEINLNCGCPR